MRFHEIYNFHCPFLTDSPNKMILTDEGLIEIGHAT